MSIACKTQAHLLRLVQISQRSGIGSIVMVLGEDSNCEPKRFLQVSEFVTGQSKADESRGIEHLVSSFYLEKRISIVYFSFECTPHMYLG